MRGPFWPETLRDADKKHITGDEAPESEALQAAKDRHPSNHTPEFEDVLGGAGA